ncbi:MAG TPA: hypothetical protein VLH15_11735 [Dehalococcoidales bacterium]|nr:hypothetical protein [Dehalococcoidales bacterium]
MKDFKEVIKLKTIPTTFRFQCSLCKLEITEFDWHFGLIKMNDHVIEKHSSAVKSLDKEDLYSRRPVISLDSF